MARYVIKKDKITLNDVKSGHYVRIDKKYYLVFKRNKYQYYLIEFNPSNPIKINTESVEFNNLNIEFVFDYKGDIIMEKNGE